MFFMQGDIILYMQMYIKNIVTFPIKNLCHILISFEQTQYCITETTTSTASLVGWTNSKCGTSTISNIFIAKIVIFYV